MIKSISKADLLGVDSKRHTESAVNTTMQAEKSCNIKLLEWEDLDHNSLRTTGEIKEIKTPYVVTHIIGGVSLYNVWNIHPRYKGNYR